ncbi:unnamed protein product [Cylindrotheca closterium]|uniref:Uncharacterized protein n=1 Tax=Cylindrotheca closterium TaxID=2856 RepID=A0AAD2FTU6_9STRA|nr:unnamed protein product [Cylindrotheca closterium]
MANSKHQRSIQFDPNVTGVGTISLDDYTPREIAATWYDEEAMDSITRRCVRILKRMETNDLKQGDKKYCTRGLEGHTTLGSINKRRSRSAAVAAVLEEQARQRDESAEIDAQAIADAYTRTTSSCQMWARVMGNRDQVAAEAFLYQADDDDCKGAVTRSAATPTSRTKSRKELNLASPHQIGLISDTSIVGEHVPQPTVRATAA